VLLLDELAARVMAEETGLKPFFVEETDEIVVVTVYSYYF